MAIRREIASPQGSWHLRKAGQTGRPLQSVYPARPSAPSSDHSLPPEAYRTGCCYRESQQCPWESPDRGRWQPTPHQHRTFPTLSLSLNTDSAPLPDSCNPTLPCGCPRVWPVCIGRSPVQSTLIGSDRTALASIFPNGKNIVLVVGIACFIWLLLV